MCVCQAAVLWNFIKSVFETVFYAWFFYKSAWAVIFLAPVGGWKFFLSCKRLEEQKTKELEGQFQECIMSVATALKAGYSLEHAFAESREDMITMFGRRSGIVRELGRICGGLKNSISLEKMLGDLGERSKSSTVREFADVLSIASQNGGNMVEVMDNTANLLAEEKRMAGEIEDIVSGRKFEGNIMKMVPFIMVIYIQSTNPGYFNMFYHNSFGICVMTACLALYILAGYMIDKILGIME